ncbi:MAG: cell division protein CrgA [Acidimicrobiales bacterium]
MVRQDKHKSRITPKGTRPTNAEVPETSPRTATPVAVRGPSPTWVPVLMFALLVVGVLMIVFNYVELLPGAASNWYLLGGLGLVLGGIVTATQLR